MWAPLVDLVRLQRWGGRKAWIVLCQLMMIVTLFGIAQIDYANNFDLLIAMVIVHNVFASTCDVAIDSLAVNTLKEDERGTGNGFMFAGAYLGQGLGGGGAIFVAGNYGFDTSFLYVCVLLLGVLSFVVCFVKDPNAGDIVIARTDKLWRDFKNKLGTFFGDLYIGFFKSGRATKVGVIFALLPFGAMALGNAVATTLQVDIGMTNNAIAELNIYSTFISGAGCVIGGWIADKLGKLRMLALYYGLTAIPTLYLALLISGEFGLEGVSIVQYFATALAFSFCMGLHYGTSAAIFMGLTSPLVAATQFTGFMAMRNLTIGYSNSWQGAAVESWGYGRMLYLDTFLVLLPILLIPFLRQSPGLTSTPSRVLPCPKPVDVTILC
jgi:PAT family beta-lactamase induction signal transducer AmpG